MGFSSETADMALLLSGRHCCLCHKYSGNKIELHHISQRAKGGKDSFENCIPLCMDCHAEVANYNSEHPKGRKFKPSELKKHRDAWYAKTKNGNNGEYPGSAQGNVTQNVSGKDNIVAGRDLTVTKKVVKKNEVIPDAGGRHITDQEAYKVKSEVQKYSDLMKEAGLDPNPQIIWRKLYRRFQVTSYRELPNGKAEEAIKFIQIEVAKTRPKVRRRNPDAWRKQFYNAIWAASKQLSMSKEEVYIYVNENLEPKNEVISLKQLTQKQLQKLDRHFKQKLKKIAT